MKNILKNCLAYYCLSSVQITTFAFVLTLCGCKNDDDLTLPPITVTGANTFGCRIDGEVYVPHGPYSEPLVDAAFDFIVVSGSMRDVTLQLIVVDTLHHPIFENQTYYFNQDNVTCRYLESKTQTTCDYRDTPVSGYIKFARIDFQRNVIAGVFEFTAYSSKCDRVVHVTEGRFDIRSDM